MDSAAAKALSERIFAPVEIVEGRLDAGALILCDHASNALPEEYGDLGLPKSAFQRHIAYDIGAAWLTRRLAKRLGAPALLTTFSRLLIDPNRGHDDPTLVMRYSDGAIVPGNGRVDEDEIERRKRRYWRPYRERIRETIAAMMATGETPAILSIHSFTPIWRGKKRPWKLGVLWDADPRLPEVLLKAFAQGLSLKPGEIGDNEPYDGALAGDTIDDVATALHLANALIEVRQDLIATRESAEGWADRLAEVAAPLVARADLRAPRDFGSRIIDGLRAR